ncbi:MAG: FHA domain-containing protein [Anaerolineae bacterium]|nr:FHA domain-containing protein [Anaerolineae bacterium]
MKIRLDVIESHLQLLIEQWLTPVLKNDVQSSLARQLVLAFQEQLAAGEAGVHHYRICLHPVPARELQNRPGFIQGMANALQSSAREAGLVMETGPLIDLVEDPNLPAETFLVMAINDPTSSGNTAVLRVSDEILRREVQEKGAFLIVNGIDIYRLTEAVINLGRRADNHLIIADSRVSRAHAQLRFTRGRFVVFDLNSTGGTTVNNQPVRQWPLKPGDVIGLAGFPLIYSEDENRRGGDDTGQTQVMRGKE